MKRENSFITVKNGTEHTYVFQKEPASEIKSKLAQILPSICVSLTCIPFGMMLGWPSPTFIILLAGTTSPVPISLGISPLIAGFLMIGNILATPISFNSYFGINHGILIGQILMTIGWTVTWQAKYFYHLFISRLLIGLGFGYSIGQVKLYLKGICKPKYADILTKLLNIFVLIGLLLAYVIGPFIEFASFSLISVCLTIVIFFVCFFLPHTPQEYVMYNKIIQAKELLAILKPQCNPDEEVLNLQAPIKTDVLSLLELFKCAKIRGNLFKLAVIVFVQQFTGVPSTLVYCQFYFRELKVPHPEFCAILYGTIFVLTSVLGAFYLNKFNKKWLLFISCACSLLALLANILLTYFNVNELYWNNASLISMILYIFVHTIGLGSVSGALVEYLFPARARKNSSLIFIILNSLFAILSTKLFQIFFSAFDFYIVFCLFSGVALFGCFFILFMIPASADNSF